MPGRLVNTPHRAWVTAMVCALLMLGSFVLAGWSLWRGKEDICRSRDVSLNVLASVLVDARDQTADALPSGDRRTAAILFYNRQLARIDGARC